MVVPLKSGLIAVAVMVTVPGCGADNSGTSSKGVDAKAVCRDLGSDEALPFGSIAPGSDPSQWLAQLSASPEQIRLFRAASAKLRHDGGRAGGKIKAAADRIAALYDTIPPGAGFADGYRSADQALNQACGGPQNTTSTTP